MKKAILTTVAIAVASASLSANAGFMFRSELPGVQAQSDQAETPEQEEERQYLFEIEYIGNALFLMQNGHAIVAEEDLTESMFESDFNDYFLSVINNAELKAKTYSNVDRFIVTATDIDSNEKNTVETTL